MHNSSKIKKKVNFIPEPSGKPVEMGLVSMPVLSRPYFMLAHIQLNLLPYMGTFNWNITSSHVITSSSGLFPGKTFRAAECCRLLIRKMKAWHESFYATTFRNQVQTYCWSIIICLPLVPKGREHTPEIWPLFLSMYSVLMCKWL